MSKTSKTTKPVKTVSASLLLGVSHAAFNFGRARTAAFVATVAAGGDSPAVMRAWHIGHMTATLTKGADMSSAAMDATEKLLDYVGAGAKTIPAGSGRRNAVQEKAYGASRTAYKVVRALAGKPKNKAKATRAAAMVGEKAPAVAPIVAAPKETSPRVTKPADAVAFLQLQAASLLAFANKNAKAMPIEARNAVAAFNLAIKALAPIAEDVAEAA